MADIYKIDVEIENEQHERIEASVSGATDLAELKDYVYKLILWECSQFKWNGILSLAQTIHLNEEYYDRDESLINVHDDYEKFEIVEEVVIC